MTSAAGADVLSLGEPVAPAGIEPALSALWRAEAEARQQASLAEGQGAQAVARTRLLNLLAYAPDPPAAEVARRTVAELTARQPARAVLMTTDPGGEAAGVEAWVRLYCARPPGSAESVCTEIITLAASGPSILDLPGTVLPLLLADAPAFLWWQAGNPLTHPLLENLGLALDRLIVDTLTFAAPFADLGQLARAFADERFHPVVTDLGWARLAPWRYLTAQVFDPPTVRPVLQEIERVRIECYEGPRVLGWLFGSWLASRLGWRLTRQDGETLRFEGGQVIELEAVPVGEETAGYFARLELRARDGARVEIARLPDACAATRVQVGPMETEHIMPVRYESLTEWLGHELIRLQRNAVFEEAVRLLTEAPRAGRRPRQPI